MFDKFFKTRKEHINQLINEAVEAERKKILEIIKNRTSFYIKRKQGVSCDGFYINKEQLVKKIENAKTSYSIN